MGSVATWGVDEVDWSKEKAKWGGKDYSRAIWVRKGYWVEGGYVRGPDGSSQKIAEHLENPTRLGDAKAPKVKALKEEAADYVFG